MIREWERCLVGTWSEWLLHYQVRSHVQLHIDYCSVTSIAVIHVQSFHVVCEASSKLVVGCGYLFLHLENAQSWRVTRRLRMVIIFIGNLIGYLLIIDRALTATVWRRVIWPTVLSVVWAGFVVESLDRVHRVQPPIVDDSDTILRNTFAIYNWLWVGLLWRHHTHKSGVLSIIEGHQLMSNSGLRLQLAGKGMIWAGSITAQPRWVRAV